MTTSNNCPLSKSVDFLGGGRGLAHCEYLQLCIREGAVIDIKEPVARDQLYFVFKFFYINCLLLFHILFRYILIYIYGLKPSRLGLHRLKRACHTRSMPHSFISVENLHFYITNRISSPMILGWPFLNTFLEIGVRDKRGFLYIVAL